EKFRKVTLKTYGLDPLYYLTLPGLSFDALLKITGVKLELFTNISELTFIEAGVRGGISTVVNRYGKANNVETGMDYQQASKYLLYLDCVSLYAYSMCQPLPTGNFRFLSAAEVAAFDLSSAEDQGPKGYILEADFSYPDYFTTFTTTIHWL